MKYLAVLLVALVALLAGTVWAYGPQTITLTVTPTSTLAQGTYVLTNGSVAVDGSSNPPQTLGTNSAVSQQWAWNGSTLDNVLNHGSGNEFLADGNNGLPLQVNSPGDNWALIAGGGGWTIQSLRTGNYLTIATGSGTLSMISGGVQAPTVWVATLVAAQASILPTSATVLDNVGSGVTLATFMCTVNSSPCSPTSWTSVGLPSFAALNSATGVLATNRALTGTDDGSYPFTVSDGGYGPQTVTLNVNRSSSGTLANGTYEFTNGGQAINSGSSSTPIAFPNTPGDAHQQWIWNGTTINSVNNYPSFVSYISDGNSGLPLLTLSPGESWNLTASGVGWTIQDIRTSNFLTLATGSGTLSMIPAGTQTPTVWTANLVRTSPQPSATLSASPTSITAGSSSTLTWSSTNALSCTGTNFSTGGALSGSVGTGALTTTTTYRVTCPGATGTTPATANATVTVSGSPSATLTASPLTVASGGSSTLTWSSTGAPSCAGTGFSTGGAPAGSVSTGPLTSNPNNYSINCNGATANASVTVQTGGGGACPGGDSGLVPAGYNCVVSSTDEFNGSSVDTNKWIISGSPGGQGPGTGLIANPSGGYVTALMTQVSSDPNVDFNGSTSMGMVSNFPIPDAPAYIEFRRRVNGVAVLMQFWTNNCHPNDGDCVGEETDIDLGPFNGCNQSNTDPGADIYGLCSGMFSHENNDQPQAFNISLDGGRVWDDGTWHIIQLQRLPDPAPNGTVRYGVDGVWLKSVTNMPDTRWIYPSQYKNGPGADAIDHFILNLFCSNGNGCPYVDSIDWDYIRVYTPSGLPNGY